MNPGSPIQLPWRGGRADALGALAVAVAGASLGWALDNNLSQRLALRDSIAVVRVKTVAAGAGFLAYGVSIVLHMLAIREHHARARPHARRAPTARALAGALSRATHRS